MTKHKFLRQRVFHDGTSMIVAQSGDRLPVPDEMLADFIADETIAKPRGTVKEAETDGDEDGEVFTMTHKPVGQYVITGPGMDEPETVRGKEAAETRIAELQAAHDAADDGAPTD